MSNPSENDKTMDNMTNNRFYSDDGKTNFEDYIRDPKNFVHGIGDRFGRNDDMRIVFPDDPKLKPTGNRKPVVPPKIDDKIVFPNERCRTDILNEIDIR
ncbi:hypothetical protein Trydic_g17717 [Trypoxylus dichotomus]